MCDAYEPPRDIDGKHVDMKPIPTNTRFACAEAMKKAEAEEPWFGIEQVQRTSSIHLAVISHVNCRCCFGVLGSQWQRNPEQAKTQVPISQRKAFKHGTLDCHATPLLHTGGMHLNS